MEKYRPVRRLSWLLFTGTLLLSPIGCSDSDEQEGNVEVDTTTGADTDADTDTDSDSDTSTGLTIPDIMAAQGIINIESATAIDPETGETFAGYQGEYEGKWTAGTNERGEVVGFDPTEPGHEGAGMVKNPKKCIVATGTPFTVGYQIGMLAGTDVHDMSRRFIRGILALPFLILGIDVDTDGEMMDSIYNFVRGQLLDDMTYAWEHAGEPGEVPLYVRREVEGLIAGAAAQGYEPDYLNVFTLSQGIDVAFTYVFGLLGYSFDEDKMSQAKRRKNLDALKAFIERPKNAKLREAIQITDDYHLVARKLLNRNKDSNEPPPLGCNHFVVSGDATVDGHTLQGRDFMFPTGDGAFVDLSRVMVYLPKEGDGELTGYPEGSVPFATVSAPGFVGHTNGVNLEGVGTGVDVSMSEAIDDEAGVGCLVIIRDMLQRAHNIEDAINLTKAFKRGFPWTYGVGDDEPHPVHGHGVILEVGENGDWLGTDTLPYAKENELYNRLTESTSMIITDEKKAEAQAMLDEAPDDGVNVRGATWQNNPLVLQRVNEMKEGMGYEIRANILTGYEPNPLYPGLPYDWDNYLFFPDQKETSDHILVLSNHNLMPHSRIAQMGFMVGTGYSLMMPDTVFRYELTLDLMDGKHDMDLKYDPSLGYKIPFYGDLDPNAPNYPNQIDTPAPFTAAWITDVLNINREVDGVDYNTGYYSQNGREGDHIVEGVHVTYDNTDKLLMGLFGYMDDPWVGVDLKPFGEYWNTHFCD
ncbi:MAG: hypothetical protein QNJ97_05435 [Myxococcota bacterium]|nr:hypothetical protein [Myxococcota bacterium]